MNIEKNLKIVNLLTGLTACGLNDTTTETIQQKISEMCATVLKDSDFAMTVEFLRELLNSFSNEDLGVFYKMNLCKLGDLYELIDWTV